MPSENALEKKAKLEGCAMLFPMYGRKSPDKMSQVICVAICSYANRAKVPQV